MVANKLDQAAASERTFEGNLYLIEPYKYFSDVSVRFPVSSYAVQAPHPFQLSF